jgi:23S rRNA (adenine2503-C2)-methyltransferase
MRGGITFEYVMLKDKKDSDEDARELGASAAAIQAAGQGEPDPVQSVAGANYECSEPGPASRVYPDIVFKAGISAPGAYAARARYHGRLWAQLKSASEKKSRAELDRLAEEKQAGAWLARFRNRPRT